jgi:hypothetical protein
MPDDQQPATQPALSGSFNQVAPKIIKLSDLQIQIDAFKRINDNGMIDKMFIDAELRAAGQKALKSDGKSVYVDSKPGFWGGDIYVDSRFVTDTVLEMRNNPALTAQQRAYLDKVDDTIEQAVQACPDQTPKLKSGAIKPFKK